MVAAVSVVKEVLVCGNLVNALDNGHVTGGHGECCLELGVGGQELDKQPGSNDFLLVVALKDAQRGTLGDSLGILGLDLRNGSNADLECITGIGCFGTLVDGTTGGTDGHVAVLINQLGEQTGGITAVQLLSGQVALFVPASEHLDEYLVLGMVKQIVVTSLGGGVGRAVLLSHGDEPVCLGVIAQRDAIGIDLKNLLAKSLHFLPGGRNGQTVCIEEGLVVVQNLGGLGHRQGVHGACVVKYCALSVEAGNEVSNLVSSQTQNGLVAQRVGNLNGAAYKAVERNNCLCHVVKCYVVGIAVSDVGLVACGQLGLDLVTNLVVAANLCMLNVNVGVHFIELCNVLIQNALVGCVHGVGEGDGHFATVISDNVVFQGLGLLCGVVAGGLFAANFTLRLGLVTGLCGRIGGGFMTALIASSECKSAQTQNKHQSKCKNSFHGLFPFVYIFLFIDFLVNKSWINP